MGKEYFLHSLRYNGGELRVQVEHVRTHRRVSSLELGHDGAVPDVEEVRERERLRRLAALQESRAALVEVPRHPAVQLGAPGRHGGTRGAGSVGIHGWPAEEHKDDEDGSRYETDGGGRRSGAGRELRRHQNPNSKA